MVFVTADNSREKLRGLTALLLSAFPGSTIHQYTDPMLSAKCVLDHKVDAVLAEARMQRVDGLLLMDVLHKNRPDLPVFILADSEEYRDAALSHGASEYLVRPITAEALRAALQGARQPKAG